MKHSNDFDDDDCCNDSCALNCAVVTTIFLSVVVVAWVASAWQGPGSPPEKVTIAPTRSIVKGVASMAQAQIAAEFVRRAREREQLQTSAREQISAIAAARSSRKHSVWACGYNMPAGPCVYIAAERCWKRNRSEATTALCTTHCTLHTAHCSCIRTIPCPPRY